jgi:hypothetical protein
MSTAQVIQDLKDQLHKSGKACNLRIAGGKQISTRCPYCGDSENRSHTHFYIQTVIGQPMLYNCFRCPAQGLLTSQTLFDLGLDNYGLISGVTSANKELLKNSQTNFVRTSANSKQITIPTVDINSLTVPKLLYVSERTGIKLDNNLISKFKLITDLEQFIDHNKITTKFNKNIVNTLTENYVGFLSNDSNFITFRNITEEKCLGRYFDLKLTDDIIIHSRKFFNITTSINLLEPKLNIILGEKLAEFWS